MYDEALLPYFSLKPNAITLYEIPENNSYRGKSCKGFKNLDQNKNQYGELSLHATKRLRNTIDFMLYLSEQKIIQGKQIISKNNLETIEFEKGSKHYKPVKFRLTFVTLTLPSPQLHSDAIIKETCLNHMLTIMRRKFKVDLYIWKAEKQANGNIHFHILCDKVIPWDSLRSEWNRIINKLNYLDQFQIRQKEYYKNGFRISENKNDKRTKEAQYKSYLAGMASNFTNPNSTDIHALHRIKNIAAYISKELSKTVTRTERTSIIKSLKTQIEYANKQYDVLNEQRTQHLTFTAEYKAIKLEMQKCELLDFESKQKLEQIVSQGIQGRIWGCSEILSKCTNYRELSPFFDIPDIEFIDKNNTGKYITDIGARKVVTYTFDITKTPALNEILKNHINSQTKSN